MTTAVASCAHLPYFTLMNILKPSRISRVMYSCVSPESDHQTLESPAVGGTDTGDSYRVVLFNDDEHSFDEVIFQIILAVRCSRQKARQLTMEVHNSGQAIVFNGSIERCIQVSAVLEEIALKTEIQSV
jgi:ATP-dependent Clp protease adaptor protein ClpS